MTQNVGSIDKILRTVVGIGLLSLLFVLEGNARWWGLAGLIPLVTVITGWCPAYSLLGANTCRSK